MYRGASIWDLVVSMNNCILRILVVGSCVLAMANPLLAETVTLTTSEWAPYSSEKAFGGGSTSLIVKKAFESQNVKFKAEFLSWDQVDAKAQSSADIQGWYPAYFSKARSGICTFSDIIGTSLVGFAHLTGSGFTWKTLDDIKSYNVGVVSGYVNEREFDRKVASGDLRVSTFGSDTENLKGLLSKSVDLAVIDRRVMVHILRKHADLKTQRSLVKFNMHALQEHPLYVCFMGADRERWASILNEGLKATSINRSQVEDPFMKRLKNKR